VRVLNARNQALIEGYRFLTGDTIFLTGRSEIEEGSPNIKGAAYFFGMNL